MSELTKTLLIFVLLIGLFGCGGSHVMRTLPSQQILPPTKEKAKIVFMRSAFTSGGVGAGIYEVVDGEVKFIGELPNGTKIVYETTPGEKVFMSYHWAAWPTDFMLANLSAGKTYYSIVRPNWGGNFGGFSPTPVRQVNIFSKKKDNTYSKNFSNWLSKTRLIGPKENAQDWFKTKQAKLQEIYEDYWSRWQKKTEAQKAQRTLNPEDGVLNAPIDFFYQLDQVEAE